MALSDEQKYRYACWLYYCGIDETEQSPLEDWEFDALQIKLGHEKTEGCVVPFSMSEEEIEEAKKWAK